MRPSVRLRLTLLYGGLFLAAGAVLLTLNYLLVRRSYFRPTFVELAIPLEEGAPGDVVGPPMAEPIPEAALVPDVVRRLEDSFRDAALRELVVQSLLALAVMAVASVGLGWLMAGRVLRPLQHITSTARRLSEENLHERIGLKGPDDELKELADTFDGMLARLDAAFDGQRRFVANASHELRTPLSIMRTEIDVALADPATSSVELRAMGERVREATERMERLIDALLTLARSERGLQVRQPVDLSEVASGAVASASADTGAEAVCVRTSLARAPVAGDPALLERLAANLVENAVRHNHPGGWVEVTTGASDGRASIRVSNSGPVVPPAEVPALFEPFRRLAAARTASGRGAGLGLSIVRSVAQAHGGTVHARARDEGGLEVVVDLPGTRDPA